MDKKGGKPPLPPKPGYVADTVRCNHYIIKMNAAYFVSMVKKTYKVTGDWSEKYNKSLVQLVLIKLRSSLSNKPKPEPKVPCLSLYAFTNIFAMMVQLVFKVGGSWSTEFNEDLIQLALFKLRSDKPVAFSYKYNPSKKQNPLSDDAIASPSKKLKGGS